MENLRRNNFDLLRLIAALQVVLTHVYSHVLVAHNYQNKYTDMVFELIKNIPGVPIFFLISGFLISLSYEKNSSLRDYITNRVLRIYPGLYLNIFIGILIVYFLGFVTFNTQFFTWLFAQLTIFQFYNIDMFREYGTGVVNGSLWTISIELTFYIVLPILFFIYQKNKAILWAIAFLTFGLWLYDVDSSRELIYEKLLHVSILPYLFIFIIGLLFFKYFDKLKEYVDNKFFIWLSIFVLFKFILYSLSLEMNFAFYTLQWIIFTFMTFSFAFSFRDLSQKLLRGNDYTYGIYIYHMLIVNFFIHIGFVGEFKYLVFILTLSILIGVTSWYLVEKPFLKLKKHSLFKEIH